MCPASAPFPTDPAACTPIGWMSAAVASISPPAAVHVPGDPAVVQTHTLPAWSITKSPRANVPDTGAPEVVAPAYRDAEDAPVRPPVDTAPLNTGPFRNPAVVTWTIVNPVT